VLHPGKRIGLAAGVEYQQRHRHLAQVKLVDQPVAGLPGQIPQQDFPGLLASGRSLDLLGVKRPDVAAVRGVGRLIRLPAEHQAQPGFPDSGVAEQDHLGVDITGRIGHEFGGAEQRIVDLKAVDSRCSIIC